MEYNFKEFFAIWAQRMHWKIPAVHMEILDFIDNEDNWENDTKVLLLWRGVGKSTITDLWIAYMLSKEPSLRFLVLSADKTTAKRTSKDVLTIIQNHPLCRHLQTAELEVQQDRFFVKGSKDPRNHSVSAFGILSNVTGGRADYIIFDDVEVKKNSGDDTKREDLRIRIGEANHLLTGPARRMFIGTYHDVVSVYDEEINNGAALLKKPLIENIEGEFPFIVGDSNWPEMFDEERIDKIQRNSHSRAEFLSQYLLVPTIVADTLLDPSLLIRYNDNVKLREVNKTTFAKIGDFNIKSCSMWWDPALSTKKRDDSVLSLVYSDERGNLFIHRVWKLTGDATQQCKQATEYAMEFAAPTICVETNGVGTFLPPLLRKECRGYGIGVSDQFTKENKKEKIVTALETPLAAGILFCHASVFNTPFLSQLRDFSDTFKGKDDYIDSVASAIKHEPVRLGAGEWNQQSKMVQQWVSQGSVELQRDYAGVS